MEYLAKAILKKSILKEDELILSLSVITPYTGQGKHKERTVTVTLSDFPEELVTEVKRVLQKLIQSQYTAGTQAGVKAAVEAEEVSKELFTKGLEGE